MHVGHVAVVSRVVGPREVLVDQANWVRGRVTKAMSVVDASPQNDWTSVKVQYAGTHGRENPTYGFIYPRVLQASLGETVVEPQHDRNADRTAVRAKRHTAAMEDRVSRAHPTPAASGETVVEPQPDRRHTGQVAEHKQHHRAAKEEQVARADPAAEHAGETILEPQHDRKPAVHSKRHKDGADKTEAAKSAEPAKPPSTAVASEHKEHKAADAKLAYVY